MSLGLSYLPTLFPLSIIIHQDIHPLPLLHRRPGLALIIRNRVQHNLDGVVLRVVLVPLAPIVTDSVCKDAACFVECRGRDAASNVGVSLKAVFGILVPEVERAVGTGCAEGTVNRVEGDGVDGVNIDDVVDGRIAVAFEREVGTA